MIYLTLEELLHVGERVIDGPVLAREPGLLEAAAARPRATTFGQDVYTSLEDKAAALVHSVVNNHALVDGNKRLGLGSLLAFLGMNGRRLTLTNDEAYDLIAAIAGGDLDDVADIASVIKAGSAPL